MNVPKRHHYVPEVILKRFTDEDGWLHLYSSHDARVRRTRIEKAFCKKHLYSEVRSDGSKDVKVEHELSWLESVLEPILMKFERSAQTGDIPRLTDLELLTWRFYLVVQWKRVPDLHKTVTTDEESAAYLHGILDKIQTAYPNRVAELEMLRRPHEIKRTVRNARIAGTPEVSDRVMRAMATRGIAILSITPPQKTIIIGSRPVVQLAFRKGLKLTDEETEMWLPISSKIAVGLGTKSEREKVYRLADHAAIRYFNLSIARQSTEFASCSEALTKSIAQAA